MKITLLLTLLITVFSLSGCDHCIKLCQFNFDYVPLLQENYCQSDISCENYLREVSYRYLSGKIQTNPCLHDFYNSECTSFSLKICSDILQSSCSRGFLSPEPVFHSPSIKDQLSSLNEESSEVEQELKQEISRQKQKYLRILNRLSELQVGM
jgi:hypothetical protein